MDKFYKLIHDGNFIGVCTSLDFCKFQKKRKILLICDETLGQYVSYKDTLYRDSWMAPVITDSIDFVECKIIEVSKDTYDTLCKAIETDQDLVFFEDETILKDEEINDSIVKDDDTLEFVKARKIAEMKAMCNKSITNGFDITLDSGTCHFSLSIYDQLNLVSMIAYGNVSSDVMYHADNELTTTYSTEDAKHIFNKYMNFKAYHMEYFHAIKAYIDAQTDINLIGGIEYGIEIPKEFKTEVLTKLEGILND